MSFDKFLSNVFCHDFHPPFLIVEKNLNFTAEAQSAQRKGYFPLALRRTPKEILSAFGFGIKPAGVNKFSSDFDANI